MAPAKAELSGAVVRALDATPAITAFGAGAAAATRIHDLDEDGPDPAERARSPSPSASGAASGCSFRVPRSPRPTAITIPAVTSGRIEPVMLAVVALLPLALFDVLSGLPGLGPRLPAAAWIRRAHPGGG